MREVNIGSKKYTVVHVADEPGQGGACHEYRISPADMDAKEIVGKFGYIKFQNGPIKEFGVNGCHQEDLIAICIDRLQHFQQGEFKCDENDLALKSLETALYWLKHRTAEREQRGVEGTNAI